MGFDSLDVESAFPIIDFTRRTDWDFAMFATVYFHLYFYNGWVDSCKLTFALGILEKEILLFGHLLHGGTWGWLDSFAVPTGCLSLQLMVHRRIRFLQLLQNKQSSPDGQQC